MRLSLPALLSLLCASTVGLDGCFGGPTNDWPGRNHGGGDTDNSDNPPSMPTDTKNPGKGGTSGSQPPVLGGSFDAGLSVPPGSDPGVHESQGDVDAGQPGDGGLSDGGLANAIDGSFVDGGMQLGCSFDSDALAAGGCFGVYCASSPMQLARSASAVGACGDAVDLSLVCDGELTRVVSACAQSEALMLGLGASVTECARSQPSLAQASDGCIDCYVGELLCAAQNCLAPCLAGLSPSCTSCRMQHCGATFQACSGLPSP